MQPTGCRLSLLREHSPSMAQAVLLHQEVLDLLGTCCPQRLGLRRPGSGRRIDALSLRGPSRTSRFQGVDLSLIMKHAGADSMRLLSAPSERTVIALDRCDFACFAYSRLHHTLFLSTGKFCGLSFGGTKLLPCSRFRYLLATCAHVSMVRFYLGLQCTLYGI